MVSFFFSSRRRHTRLQGDWSSDVCSSDLRAAVVLPPGAGIRRHQIQCAVRKAPGGVGTGMRQSNGRAVGRSVGGLVTAVRSAGPRVRLTALLVLAACQPQARRVLLLDLALSVRAPTTTGGRQRWAEAGVLGDEPLGSVFDPFPLDRNNVLAARDSSQLLAVTSRHAFVRAARTPASRPRAGVVAAARIGHGLVVVISRHALGALGPQFRSTTAPVQQLDALERTREFLGALARWIRRPAEWAHVPPAAHGVPLSLAQAPVPVELAPPVMTPPGGVDTIELPLVPDPKLARATNMPEWLRQQGMRVLWT